MLFVEVTQMPRVVYLRNAILVMDELCYQNSAINNS